MKPKSPVFAFLPAFVLLGISSVQAQWSGLGVGAATGNDLASSANWTGGTINGDLSTINTIGTHNLVLSGNISVASLNFDNAASTNTVALTSGGNGTGYTSAGTTVTISAPTGTPPTGTATTATATENITSGAITSITINSHGTGYYGTTLPDFILTGDGTGAVKGLSGALPTGATIITVNSDTVGVTRTISVGGNITIQDRSDSTLTFGADTVLDLTANSGFVQGGGGVFNDSTNVFVEGDITSAGSFTFGKSSTGTVTNNGDVTFNALYSN
ncbi:MAG TPA: hypothetical protein VM511_10070, partial [Luteolibacter sp.]|nr:hypothetical protein [Luteolibacter sp.]